MRPNPGRPYYTAYDDRYRSVYGQGVRYWSAAADETNRVLGEVEAMVVRFALAPGRRIVEFGCGEAYLGPILASRDFDYTGVDVAPAALDKARERLAPFADRARVVLTDMVRGPGLSPAAFDAGLDILCYHMLVVDADRQAYLRNVATSLKPGAPLLLIEGHDASTPDWRIDSYDDWCKLTGQDFTTPEPRSAFEAGREVTIQLPRIAHRPRSLLQYEAELRAAGFQMVESRLIEDNTTCLLCQRR